MKIRRDFIEAFCWEFGCTKKKANEVFSLRIHDDPEYVHEVIAFYKCQNKKAFYED